MEEAKAASYYDELTRKGEGAARFKQGLGFSSSSLPLPSKPSSSSSPLFSNFVRATSPSKSEKQAQLQTIQAKLRRSHQSSSSDHRRTSRSSSRDRVRVCGLRGRDRRRRSRSWSEEEGEDREGDYRNRNARRKSGSRSPSRVSSRRDLEEDCEREEGGRWHGIAVEKVDGLDYGRLIEGYLEMTPAERVRAKMKLQLSQTAAKDSTMGMSSGWERFDFNKDAPLDDDDDEIEVAEDDASLVKEIGNSFRYSAVQAKREEQIKAAHDEAMFGASAMAPTIPESETYKDEEKTDNESQDNNFLISDKVLALQRGSWRDRVGRFKSGSD